MARDSVSGKWYFALGAVLLGAASGDFAYWIWHGNYDSNGLPGPVALAFAALMLWLGIQGRKSLLGVAWVFAAASLALPWLPLGRLDAPRRVLVAAGLAAVGGAIFVVVAVPMVKRVWRWVGACAAVLVAIARVVLLHVLETISASHPTLL